MTPGITISLTREVSLQTKGSQPISSSGYRALGVDLQQLVHEDMSEHFRLYPQLWEQGSGS